ncbi:MAG: DUF948 domain-containing protein [Bacteroidetes bacterium]|nr:DUF948 domain-containing protein [Bacteroidota bacterium]MBX7045135.1 DUF948 domain-containing protein [Ignavibacteria bacterium]
MADTFIIISVILQILIIGVLIGFVAVLIKLIKALAEKVESVSDDVMDLKTKAEPLIENANKFLSTANRIASAVDKNMDTVTSTVKNVKDTVTKVTELVDTVREKVQPPVMETVASVSGIVKGVKVFFDAIKSKREERKSYEPETDFEIDYDEKYLKNHKKKDYPDTSEYSELDNINAELNELRKKIQQTD